MFFQKRKNKNYIKIIKTMLVALFLLSSFANASTNTSAAFLKITGDARSIGMGGASCALAEGVSSLEINPGGLSWSEEREAIVSHNEWFAGIRSEYIGYTQPIGWYSAIGFSMYYLYMGGITRRDVYGRKLGDFGAKSSMMNFSFSTTSSDYTSLGINLKTVSESIDDKKGAGYAVDLGVSMRGDIYRFGASLQNMGKGIKLYKERFPLPMMFTLGFGFTPEYLGSFYAKGTTFAMDYTKEFSGDSEMKMGGEYLWKKKIAFRAGYRFLLTGHKQKHLSLGLGFRRGNVEVDYAFVPYKYLGSTHRVSLKIIIP